MIERTLDHVAIAVTSIDEALPIWTAILGGTSYGRERILSQESEIVFIGHGPGRIELVAPTSPSSPVARFLEKRGPGLHHVCYRVTDISQTIAELASSGFRLVDSEPRPGAHDRMIAFLHPEAAGGVLVELVEETSPNST
jgi:methylmalonyl-CoA epimerase